MSVYPDQYCRERIGHLRNELQLVNKRRSVLAWLRFLSLALPVALIWLFHDNGPLFITAIAVTGCGAFLKFVSTDLSAQKEAEKLHLLIDINEAELRILSFDFSQTATGQSFQPHEHPYAADLDIFGQASLFQLVCRASSFQGQDLLAQWFLSPAGATEIKIRQQAVLELAGLPEFRQNLQAAGIENPITEKLQSDIQAWTESAMPRLEHKIWNYIRIILPVLNLSLLACYIFSLITSSAFWSLLIPVSAISFWLSKICLPYSLGVSRAGKQLSSLQEAATQIENISFRGNHLQALQSVFQKGSGSCASAVKRLHRIMDRLDYRLNPLVYLPLNIFLCWDLQQTLQLKKWKQEQKAGMQHWFSALAEMEALASLGNLSGMHPGWTFPVITSEEGVFQAVQLGHPLIHPDKLVRSDFSTNGRGHLNIITGSNMAGKSTFLRSCGVNAVLALAGAPVNASSFTISEMQLMSSMRISDNLEENTSTFYAELKKLRNVIEATRSGKPVFLLLDEILRGTNSADRQTGSMALVKQLLRDRAAGLIATHDLALAQLVSGYPDQLTNYHFDVQVSGEELYFDYKLKPGICTSLNASLLMKKIGIDLSN